MIEDRRFAVLIDADNVSAKYIKYILEEMTNYGVATYKRIYADWTKPSASSWKDVLLDNSVTPIQQYGYTVGKNATDSAMIIDAMDILYSGNVEGYCLVSSDSDFTKLSSRLRESGMFVVGMGEKKTPKPFIAACNQFKYLDVLAQQEKEKKETTDSSETADLNAIKNTIVKMLGEIDAEDQSMSMGELGNRLVKRFPDFDVRNYGYNKLSLFLKKEFNFVDIKTKGKDGTAMWVSLKKEK
ncbi:NYN domain-containing protein [Parasporobacterium paucivorans]|uniref:OST-HTH/LOTUS domain-containing protein n=1 Tax=Parasporobacterium paucivorans DSM 15970 TaxID=1122934 RepID=A0A1M6A9X4_9FIRM|nr:NYN domain-containing protein [Parasporobacterium paucivorans]SHI33249.1 OST-HTH/LOTUS domain-containing protein [Parasporobacterium paucivorans DSM 15970]